MIPEYKAILDRTTHRRKHLAEALRTLRKERKKELDVLYGEAHDHAFSQIDCTKCGNCCACLGPRIRQSDIKPLAAFERLKPQAFIDRKLKEDEDGDLVFPQMPCPYFGADGLCIVYDKRPRACREYPHLDQKRQKGLLGQHLADLSICPAVALAAEYIEKLLKE